MQVGRRSAEILDKCMSYGTRALDQFGKIALDLPGKTACDKVCPEDGIIGKKFRKISLHASGLAELHVLELLLK